MPLALYVPLLVGFALLAMFIAKRWERGNGKRELQLRTRFDAQFEAEAANRASTGAAAVEPTLKLPRKKAEPAPENPAANREA